MRFTLTYLPTAKDELAELWLDAKDQNSVTQSSNAIERELRDDPDQKGEVVEGPLRKIVAAPLVYYFVVSPDDRLATVWSVRWALP
jgi:hypothetical protein